MDVQVTISKISDIALPWLLDHGIKIVIILVVFYVLKKFGSVFIERLMKKTIVRADIKRRNTLAHILVSTFKVLMWVVVALLVLSEIGVEIGPLLAAAGIAGLAFGFGGQYLIRDVISGLFIIMENQYGVGDVVCFDGVCGMVEDISLRMTSLRDLDGTTHFIPHGEIKKTANLSKEFARVNLNIGVAYDSNLERVIEVINRVGTELAGDSEWSEKIKKAPQFLRVNDFADSAIMMKILGETQPLKQWEVTGELRKRLKMAFDKEGIEIPFPQRVVHSPKKV